jgi:transcriptional regulator with XRE-family HTH domain
MQQQELLGMTGPDVRRLRRARGLTLKALARAAGLNFSRLSLIEREREPLTPGLEIKIARALWP